MRACWRNDPRAMLGDDLTSRVAEPRKDIDAWHEAGHVLIGLHRGVAVLRVTIEECHGTTGMTTFRDGDIPPIDEQWISVAGAIADYVMVRPEIDLVELREYFDEITYSKARDDHNRFVWTLHKLGLLTKEQIEHPLFESFDGAYELVVRPRLNERIDEASRILAGRRNSLERLADALIDRKTLTGNEIKDLLTGSTNPFGPHDDGYAFR